MKGFEKQLDDEANAGTFQFFDLSVDLMDKAVAKTQGWYREILAKPSIFPKRRARSRRQKTSSGPKTTPNCAAVGKNG